VFLDYMRIYGITYMRVAVYNTPSFSSPFLSPSHANTTVLISFYTQFSIVVRILRSVQDNEMSRRMDEARRRQDTQKLLDTLIDSGIVPRELKDGLPVSSSHKSLSDKQNISKNRTMSNVSEDKGISNTSENGSVTCVCAPKMPALPPSEVIPALRTLQYKQNSHDAASDLEDLRRSMRAAMQMGSDVAVVEMMQVPREEMPEAMKTLQRALERVVERQELVGTAEEARAQEKESELPLGSGSGGEWCTRDTLDREFIETGIEALRRLSEGLEAMPLPSWTITRRVSSCP
jgi:hypothetical protein